MGVDDGMRSIVATKRANAEYWPTPKPIPSELARVDAFALDFLPVRLAPWIDDIASRLQCPPDYPAITAMTALGAILGRKIAIKPQIKTDWIEIPNIWGAFIGPPGMLKSPAMNEALRPIHRLEAEAVRNNEIAQQAYAAGLDAFRLRKQVATALAKEELKKALKGDNHSRRIELALGEPPQEPTPVRYRTNDTSYEALAELIANNPTGMLVERDELVSLLRHLDRNDQAVARGFFLTGWSGTQPYTLDRISRGTRHIERFASRSWATRSLRASRNTSNAPTATPMAVTAYCKDLGCWPGPTCARSGKIWTAIRTAAPAKMRAKFSTLARSSLALVLRVFPIRGDGGPIVGRLIGRVSPDEENGERERDAEEGKYRKNKRPSSAAQQDREYKICNQRAE
jgi:Protein of unknown function (DUF3987)